MASRFDSLVIFGDSLSDAGNHFDMIGTPSSPPYFEGRFTNGNVWSDHLSEAIGLPTPVASRLGGDNYAYGGAQSGDGYSTITAPNEIPNVGLQIEQFVATGQTLDETDLIVLWVGHNDLFGSIAPATIAENLSEHLNTLYGLGGRNFLTADYCCDETTSTLSGLLYREIRDQRRQHSDATFAEFSFSGLIQEIASNQAAFGITNGSEAACQACGPGAFPLEPDVRIVSNPDEYFLWDDVHPTSAAHLIMGERAIQTTASTFDLVVGDCSDDGLLSPSDLECVSTIRQRDAVLDALKILPGDFNGDSAVDFADFLIMSANYGQDASYAGGDLDLANGIDFADFLTLSSNFGQPSRNIAAVPEPSCVSLLFIASVVSLFTRRHVWKERKHPGRAE